MKRLSCVSCGAPLGARQLDRRLGTAACAHCGSIFDLAKPPHAAEPDVRSNAGDDHGSTDAGFDSFRANAPVPSRFRLDRRHDRLRISWRWFSLHGLYLLVFAIAWDSFLVFWYIQPTPLSFKLFALAHVAAGIAITYAAIANLLNRSTITLTRTSLSVRHRPILWLPAPTIRTAEIAQFCVIEQRKRFNQNENHPRSHFQLRAVDRDNRQRELLALDAADEALFLERMLEQTLGLRDRPVPGEPVPGEIALKQQFLG